MDLGYNICKFFAKKILSGFYFSFMLKKSLMLMAMQLVFSAIINIAFSEGIIFPKNKKGSLFFQEYYNGAGKC